MLQQPVAQMSQYHEISSSQPPSQFGFHKSNGENWQSLQKWKSELMSKWIELWICTNCKFFSLWEVFSFSFLPCVAWWFNNSRPNQHMPPPKKNNAILSFDKKTIDSAQSQPCQCPILRELSKVDRGHDQNDFCKWPLESWRSPKSEVGTHGGGFFFLVGAKNPLFF